MTDPVKTALERIAGGQSEWKARPTENSPAPGPRRAVIPEAPALPQQPTLRIPARPLPEEDPWTLHRKPAAPQDTEAWLNTLIGECHFLMSEVAYRCLAQSSDPQDRLAFMRVALECAHTGAHVAQSVATLRSTPLSEDRRFADVVEAHKILDARKKAEAGKQ
ncbi:MAG: hypothetical protein WDM91_10180 [Rhizomicrobium sp.]